MLTHEKLDAYQCSLKFAALSFQVLPRLGRGYPQLADQLRRATMSIPLNIAEGVGKSSARDGARFHAIARGSAMECAAILDLLHLQKLIEPKTASEGKALLTRLVSMLSRMSR